MDRKVSRSPAQTNSRGGQRGVLPLSSGRGCWPDPVVVLVAGLIALVGAFVRFVVEGFGTPAPVAAPERLVVGGVYRHVRNPMYVAVLAAIVAQALILGRLGLLLYACAAWLVVAAFVRIYEEPTLTRRFGADYEAYRRAVPAWWPRLRPWKPGELDEPGAR
jgi:protein-S-isoprenylcysteine O-methyltransferase Ste14